MLTQEIFDTLPESVQGDYELSGDSYVTKDSLKVGALKESLNGAYAKRDEATSQLSTIEQTKADEIEQAKKEAYEKAVNDNDFASQAKMLEEKRIEAEQASELSKTELNDLRANIADEKHNVLVGELSLLAIEESKPLIEIAIRQRTSIDPLTQQEIYLNSDGSASELDKKGFIESLKNDPVFKTHLKGELPTKGGGQSNGSQGFGASAGKPPKNMTTQERIDFKQRDPIGFKQAFNL